jgi:glycosyltransferase involved in cell wall biosynthesis
MAPWISLLIKEFEKYKDNSLHIIAPFRWLKKDFNFKRNGVNYYFIKTGMPLIHRHWPRFFRIDLWSGFYCNRRKIIDLVKKINPDIINLHGIENPYYSTSIFGLKKYPVLITIQGLNSLSPQKDKTYFGIFKKDLEQKILKEFNNYGIRVKYLEEYIRKINPRANFFWFKYPFDSALKSYLVNYEKSNDFIFFGRVSKDKGVEDLIDATANVVKTIKTVSLKIIGACDLKYKKYLMSKIKYLNLENNVLLLGFMNKREELHIEVAKSKITVLPTYNDILPGTIIESLRIGTPVIAYAANGVVDFNNEKKIVELVSIGDIKNLTNKMIDLLNNDCLREQMSVTGKQYVIKEFNNESQLELILEAYRKVIDAKLY